MPNQPPPIGSDSYFEPEDEGPGIVDGMRFLYRRRMKLCLLALIFFGIGLIIYLISYLTAPMTATSIIALRFAGIEKQEYPNGQKFSVEDFRNPDVLKNAIAIVDLAGKIRDVDLAAHLCVIPAIPADVQNRWRKQEKDGVKKEEYIPTDFLMEIDIGGLADNQRVRLLSAVAQQYRNSIKHTQESALEFAPEWETSYENLANSYDFWDIPEFFQGLYRMLNKRIEAAIEETEKNEESKKKEESEKNESKEYQLAFRNIARELGIWHLTRLLSLEAATYQGKLVKDKDLMMQRVQYRIEDLDIQIRNKIRESGEATGLLKSLEPLPQTVIGKSSINREISPIVDIAVIDKLIKSNYVEPIAKRILKLQQETQELETEKARLQKQLTRLPKSNNLTLGQMSAGQKKLIDALSSELKELTRKYNVLLDNYLTGIITNKVLMEAPLVSRKGYSPILVFPILVILSLFLAVFYLAMEHLIRQARTPEKARPADGSN
jgi:hypothetical protein